MNKTEFSGKKQSPIGLPGLEYTLTPRVNKPRGLVRFVCIQYSLPL